MLYADLRRSYNMSRWVHAEFYPIDSKGFTPGLTAYGKVTKSVPDDGHIGGMGNVFFMSPPAMICMSVGDDSLIYWFPGIQIYIGFLTINTPVRKLK